MNPVDQDVLGRLNDGLLELLLEGLSSWQLLRKMGYPADEIFFVIEQESKDAHIQLQHRGKRVDMRLGSIGTEAPSEVFAFWETCCRWYASLPDYERRVLFEKSKVRAAVVDIVKNLLDLDLGTTPEQIERYDAMARESEIG
jgi:hypothetical protein